MLPHEAATLALGLMAQHGLQGWSFKIDNAKSRRGLCSYRRRTISVSRHLLPFGVEQVSSTILHEIAHALVGPFHDHNHVWQAKARELGCSGERCGASMDVARKWAATCPECGKVARRHRLTARIQRSACCPCKPWNADRVLTWKQL